MTFGERLKELREAAGLSLSELAAASGIQRTYIVKLQSTTQNPEISTAERLARALKVPLATLVGVHTDEGPIEPNKGDRRFGERLRQLRIAAGLSTPALAKLSGVGQSTIVGYEQGSRTPRIDNVRKLAAALGVLMSELHLARKFLLVGKTSTGGLHYKAV